MSLELQTANDADLINPASPAGLVSEGSGHHRVWVNGGRGKREGEEGKDVWPLNHQEPSQSTLLLAAKKLLIISLDVIYIYFKASA